MIRAIQYRRFGGPEVLEMADVAAPAPGNGEIRLAVKAAGLNPVDWKIFSGATGGDASTLPQGVGRDYSGLVEAVGEGVADFAVGDAVLGTVRGAPGVGMVSGSLAEALVVPADWAVRKPDALGFHEAAALGVAAQAASGALRTLELSEGDVIVVSGASGGVGSRGEAVGGLASATVGSAVRAVAPASSSAACGRPAAH